MQFSKWVALSFSATFCEAGCSDQGDEPACKADSSGGVGSCIWNSTAAPAACEEKDPSAGALCVVKFKDGETSRKLAVGDVQGRALTIDTGCGADMLVGDGKCLLANCDAAKDKARCCHAKCDSEFKDGAARRHLFDHRFPFGRSLTATTFCGANKTVKKQGKPKCKGYACDATDDLSGCCEFDCGTAFDNLTDCNANGACIWNSTATNGAACEKKSPGYGSWALCATKFKAGAAPPRNLAVDEVQGRALNADTYCGAGMGVYSGKCSGTDCADKDKGRCCTAACSTQFESGARRSLLDHSFPFGRSLGAKSKCGDGKVVVGKNCKKHVCVEADDKDVCCKNEVECSTLFTAASRQLSTELREGARQLSTVACEAGTTLKGSLKCKSFPCVEADDKATCCEAKKKDPEPAKSAAIVFAITGGVLSGFILL